MYDADSFLQFLTAERRLSPNTLAAYRNDLRQFEEYLAVRQHDPLGTGATNGTSNGTVAPADATSRLARAGRGLLPEPARGQGVLGGHDRPQDGGRQVAVPLPVPAGCDHHEPDRRSRLAGGQEAAARVPSPWTTSTG